MHLLPKGQPNIAIDAKIAAARFGGSDDIKKYVCGKCRGRLLEIGNDEKSQVEK